MRKIMIFQHVGHEPLGTLDPMLKAAGFRIRYVNFARDPDVVPNLDGYNGLIILGGPMGVYEADKHSHIKVELQLIEQALKKGIPILGICLGAQLLATVLGAEIKKAPMVEFGWHDIHVTDSAPVDPLFADFSKSEKIFQLHQDMFEIPRSSTHLAWSSLVEGQAFRYGEKAYGLQFHLEADQPMIQRWLSRPENLKLMNRSIGNLSVEQVEKETEAFIKRSLELSQSCFQKFIDIFQLPERPVLLGSDHTKKIK